MSEIIVFILIIMSMLITYILYKLYGKKGLYYSLVVMSLITFIFSFKIINIFTLDLDLNIIPMVGTFTIVYLIISRYGIKESKNIIKLTLYTNIISAILILVTNYYIPSITETITISMEGTFLYNYKILIVYPILMALTEFVISKLFEFIKLLSSNIYINTIIIYIITGLLYTVIFYMLVYIDILPTLNRLFLGVTTFLIGLIITVINTTLIGTIKPRMEVKL